MSNRGDDVLKTVHFQYAAVANSPLSNDSEAVRSVASAFGYSAEELDSLPSESNMGLSCGNPVAVASLRAGEVVVDLGCGGGLDVLLAAKKVGPTGRAIGIDMTADMLDRARAGAARTGATNVEFHQAHIDDLPLPDGSVDCIISNCVINLAPDKSKVFAEIFRVLKPGGRVAISDIALKQSLPPEIADSLEAYVGCIAGALLIADYRELLRGAGFESVTVTDSGADLNAYARLGLTAQDCCSTPQDNAATQSGGPGDNAVKAVGGDCCTGESQQKALPGVGCCGSSMPALHDLHSKIGDLLTRFDANQYAASVKVHAVKQ